MPISLITKAIVSNSIHEQHCVGRKVIHLCIEIGPVIDMISVDINWYFVSHYPTNISHLVNAYVESVDLQNNCREHYDDVIMGAIASQITSPAIVYSTVYSDADQRKHQSSVWHWPLCGEFTGDRWILRTMASNAENVSISWRHHEWLWGLRWQK